MVEALNFSLYEAVFMNEFPIALQAFIIIVGLLGSIVAFEFFYALARRLNRRQKTVVKPTFRIRFDTLGWLVERRRCLGLWWVSVATTPQGSPVIYPSFTAARLFLTKYVEQKREHQKGQDNAETRMQFYDAQGRAIYE